MIKRLLTTSCILILTACTSAPAPTPDRGQQNKDGDLPQLLNKTTQVTSNQPKNLNTFARQAQAVIDNSPRMAQTYKHLYIQIEQWIQKSGDPQTLADYGLQTAQVGGSDHKGNVLFTGYFSPVIELRHQADQTFKYPVYKKPQCSANCPTRAQIYQGALEGQGLELGYAANLIDPFIMEVQGSGFVHFGDDNTLEYFAYGGKNNRAYVSIGRILIERGEVEKEKMSLKAIKEWVMAHDEATVRALLEQNPSYVFFEPQKAAPVRGTAGIPLLPMASVAGDRSLFPMGTPVLAEVPLLNADGTFSGTYQLRVLIVLDTGGAVKNSHLDLYHGMGARAGIEAGHYRHFGRVWKLGLDGDSTQSPWTLSPEKIK